MNWLLLAALLLAAVFACHDTAPSRFPHQLHLSGIECGGPDQPGCLTCNSCHRDTDRDLEQRPGPPLLETCEACHGPSAATWLQRSQRPALEPPPLAHGIHFDHPRHLDMPAIRGQCIKCHQGAVQESSELFPPMVRCFQCHEHQAQFDRGQCEPCHDPVEVRELLPVTFLRHDIAWQRHHGTAALQEPELCASCHQQTECDDCHDVTQTQRVETRRPDAIERRMTHPGDFLTRHALEARSQPAQCLTCHTPETCDSCHLERGVSGNALGARNPHPPGWVGGNPASRDFHGRAARRDLLSCAACHDQGPATNCIQCHRVGGPGGNPHPRGRWTSQSPESTMCRYCHVQ